MDPVDARVRFEVYRWLSQTGRAPSRRELSEALGMPVPEAGESLERLGANQALLLQPKSREILIANPFSAVPTPFLVRGGHAHGSPLARGMGSASSRLCRRDQRSKLRAPVAEKRCNSLFITTRSRRHQLKCRFSSRFPPGSGTPIWFSLEKRCCSSVATSTPSFGIGSGASRKGLCFRSRRSGIWRGPRFIRIRETWYANRLIQGWKRRSVAEIEAILEGAGLNGPFWRLR